MIVGVPKETKDQEYRVAMTPGGIHSLVENDHRVLVQASAGEASGISDDEYSRAGASIVSSASDIFSGSDIVIKVKEPIEPEYELLHSGLVVFGFLHLAAEEKLTRVLMESGATAIAYETIELPDGSLPLLAPMSEVAGKVAMQSAAHCLGKDCGGAGKLVGGVPGVAPCKVVIVGGGIVGASAARVALGLGAQVTIIDKSIERLRYLTDVLHGNLQTLASDPANLAAAVRDADIVIGAVLVHGARAPKVVTRKMVGSMRPGSVIVDVAVDQGGCVETTRPTCHTDPLYVVDNVVHSCVTNLPGVVPCTSTFALTNATLPYAVQLANKGFKKAVSDNPALAKGVNVYAGKITYQSVAEAFGLEYTPLIELLR